MSITLEMTQACYEAAKLIYPNKNEITTKAKAIENELGMNFNSAKDYISSFFLMMDDERLLHAMSEEASNLYLRNIFTDFGIEKLISALFSLQRYLNFDSQNHPGLQTIIDDFFDIYIFTKLKVGEIASHILLYMLNLDSFPEDEIKNLQDENYCNENFNLYLPVLKKYNNSNVYRYYSPKMKLVTYKNDTFLLTNDWYEDKNRHNLEPLCKWISTMKYKI